MLAQFVAEILEVLFGQPAFEKRAGVHAGRGVALEIDQVARLIAVAEPWKKWLNPTSSSVASDA